MRTTRPARYFLLLIVLLYLTASPAAIGQLRDDFEAPDHVLKLSGADCGVRTIAHKRTFDQFHAGSSSEHLRFVAGQGTHIYFAYPVGRAPIIEESKCSLWIKADRARLQLLTRVVLPRTLDERTGKPITALLQGDEYGEIGSWQQLHVKDLDKLLTRQLVVLRKQFGPHVDPGEAYIDLLVVNAYGGAGETNVWIDDLEVLGVVDEDWAKNVVPRGSPNPSSGEATSKPATPPAVMDGNVLLIENRPAFVLGVEHRGERLEAIKALGFNTVVSRTPVTAQLNEDARRLGLWLIAPPPDVSAGDNPVGLDRVICWQLGDNLGSNDLVATRALAAELRKQDASLRRPLLCGTAASAWNYSRDIELLSGELSPLFGTSSFASATNRLRAELALARAGAPYWAVVPLSPAKQLVEQLSLLDPNAPQTLVPDLQQARLATLSALGGGARGLIFRLPLQLDGEDEQSQQCASVMRLVNAELRLMEPWLAGSSTSQEINVGDPGIRATVLQTERSRLILLVREPPFSQFIPPPGGDSMLVSLPGVPSSDRLYHVTSEGAKQVDRPIGTATARLHIPETGDAAILAVTQDPLVVQHLLRTGEAQRKEMLETRLHLASNQLTSTALVGEEIRQSLQPPPTAVTTLREAQRFLQEGNQLLARGDLPGSSRHTRRAENLIAQVRRSWWDSARSSFTSPLSTPCCATYETLPSHVRLAMRLQQGQWSKNGLTAGDCERLEQLLATGWKQQRSDSAQIVSSVELSKEAPHGGSTSVRLVAQPRDKRAAPAGPNVVLKTGPLRVKPGQVARLHGYVRIPAPLSGDNGGLVVYDNLAGEQLAEIIPHAPAWREFVFYRGVPNECELTLTFALHGFGEVWLDDITIELNELPQ